MNGLARAAAGAAAAVAVLLAAGSVTSTSAAWTDSVHVAAATDVGTWADQEPDMNGPFEPGEPSTVIGQASWTMPATNTSGYCAALTITTTSPTPIPWSMIIHLDEAPYWGAAGMIWGQDVEVTPVSGDPTRAVVTGRYPYETIAAGTVLTTSICNANAVAPPVGDPDWYTVTTAVKGTWTATRACIDITVTGRRDLAEYPYFFGWTTTVDLSAAKAAMTAAGGHVNHVDWSPAPSGGYAFTVDPSSNSPVADRYTLTSGTITALRGTQSQTITVCVNGY
ncbi:hypothetical protein [Microbacterium terricola]|uniref:Uncharacterized protein n=1 Tax=Microbacterium terricola TaxID=344163 RepID=A0ABM8E280_9MICO|nr:hypothetical protein [Microbacterium terricola]UYK40226.1 hypothetical protein OAU46_00825 [Microbacterium terricola]BDV32067.1 hypothetical protein Microterr_27270 [Microbacterium terricola]